MRDAGAQDDFHAAKREGKVADRPDRHLVGQFNRQASKADVTHAGGPSVMTRDGDARGSAAFDWGKHLLTPSAVRAGRQKRPGVEVLHPASFSPGANAMPRSPIDAQVAAVPRGTRLLSRN